MNLKSSLDSIIKKYNLSKDDVYQHKDGWKIITANGIKRMVFKECLNVTKTLEYYSFIESAAVAKCQVRKEVSTKDDYKYLHYEAMGEASPSNCVYKDYIVNVAEKRAEGRAVLQSLGLYADLWRSEEEMDEMVAGAKILEKRKEQTQAATQASLHKIEMPKSSRKSLLAKAGIRMAPNGEVASDGNFIPAPSQKIAKSVLTSKDGYRQDDPRESDQEPAHRNEDC